MEHGTLLGCGTIWGGETRREKSKDEAKGGRKGRTAELEAGDLRYSAIGKGEKQK